MSHNFGFSIIGSYKDLKLYIWSMMGLLFIYINWTCWIVGTSKVMLDMICCSNLNPILRLALGMVSSVFSTSLFQSSIYIWWQAVGCYSYTSRLAMKGTECNFWVSAKLR